MRTTMKKTSQQQQQQHQRQARVVFSIEEDQQLIELVKKYGENWRKISDTMPSRSTRQCKERYIHYLSPDISQAQWTEEEDEILQNKVNEIGKKWKALEIFFEKRTEIAIRNRWNVLDRKAKKEVRKALKKKTQQSKNDINVSIKSIDHIVTTTKSNSNNDMLNEGHHSTPSSTSDSSATKAENLLSTSVGKTTELVFGGFETDYNYKFDNIFKEVNLNASIDDLDFNIFDYEVPFPIDDFTSPLYF